MTHQHIEDEEEAAHDQHDHEPSHVLEHGSNEYVLVSARTATGASLLPRSSSCLSVAHSLSM